LDPLFKSSGGEAEERWQLIRELISGVPTLIEIPEICDQV